MPNASALVVKYETTEDQILELGASFRGVTFDTPANYEIGRKAIAQVRSLRTAVEKRRKELKADSISFGRLVDSLARELTDKLEAIEAPLLTAKKAVDDEDDRLKREKEHADLVALEARLKADREQAEALAKAEREVEDARLAAERERLAAQQAQYEESNRVAVEVQKVERAKLDAEKAELRKQQDAIAAQAREADRVETERRRRDQAEQDKLAADEAAKVEAARLEALRPEVEKVHAFAAEIRALADRGPVVESVECRRALEWAFAKLAAVASGLDAFRGKTGP